MRAAPIGEHILLVSSIKKNSDSSSILPAYVGGTAQPSDDRRAETSTFAITSSRSDWLQLGLDDIVQELCGWEALLAIALFMFILFIFLRKSYGVSLWFVIIAGILFAVFYLYWVCIRSPSQYYSHMSSVTTNYFQTRVSMSNISGGEPVELETTDDIINTTTYQAAPAFGRNSIIGNNNNI